MKNIYVVILVCVVAVVGCSKPEEKAKIEDGKKTDVWKPPFKKELSKPSGEI